MKKLKNKKGFTLIELIVVVAILGILALILVPSFMGYAEDAKEAVATANARNVYTAYKAADAESEYKPNLTSETLKLTRALEILGPNFKTEDIKFQNASTDIIEVKTNDTTCTVTISTGAIAC